ncbi:interleukin-1 receptor accessory protein [Hippocampus comes]|uniref:interleukin-1 receptor accessory protein n=1 Tax=Hippocampus comes TaxID=109280 RepID=UPI00094EBAC0|nr:PREDICTED: interleukin-1 receptor accessory protein-like [Hippocampus comes]
MAWTLVILLVPLLVATVTADLHTDTGPPGTRCQDWDESWSWVVHVLEGEAAWVRCPLWGHPALDNSSRDLTCGRLSKEYDRLCFQPAVADDSGCYACLPRNSDEEKFVLRTLRTVLENHLGYTVCIFDRDSLPGGTITDETLSFVARSRRLLVVLGPGYARQGSQALLELKTHTHTHTQCDMRADQKKKKMSTQGSHRATQRQSNAETCALCCSAPPFLPKEPSVLQPTSEHVFHVKRGSSVRLVCRGRFPYLDRDSDWAIWWSVDGNAVERLADPRFSASNGLVSTKHGDRIEESVLLIRDFGSEDLGKTYNCSVKNRRGFQTRRAQLQEEAWVPWLEVGCGLSLILALSLAVSALYSVFRLELLLLYRSRFGADERHTDDKEFDVYISYARNSDEEKFVLRTLRTVLENHLGYTVCIFDRDSLPGGTITDETLSFVARSRRLLVVLGPGYARQGSQALLELKAGMDGLAGGHLRLILVQYKRVRRREWVRELRRARVALAVVSWQGEPSREMTSRFWKKLRLELPVRRMPGTRAGHGESDAEAGLMSPPAGHRAPLDLKGS